MSKHRAELEEKVVARRKQLQDAFTLAEREGPPERRTGIEAALRLVDDATQGGWEKVSEVGAADLTKWLETTQSMVASDAPVKTEPKTKEADPPKAADPVKAPDPGMAGTLPPPSAPPQ